VELEDCCEFNQIPLKQIFDEKIITDRGVFASWYTDQIEAGFGRFLEFDSEKWQSKYEHQIIIEFVNGKVRKLISTKES